MSDSSVHPFEGGGDIWVDLLRVVVISLPDGQKFSSLIHLNLKSSQ